MNREGRHESKLPQIRPARAELLLGSASQREQVSLRSWGATCPVIAQVSGNNGSKVHLDRCKA